MIPLWPVIHIICTARSYSEVILVVPAQARDHLNTSACPICAWIDKTARMPLDERSSKIKHSEAMQPCTVRASQ